MLAGSVSWDAVDDRERRWPVYWVRDCELLDLEENGEELVGPIADLKSSSDAGENTDSKTRRRAGMMGSVGGIADVT